MGAKAYNEPLSPTAIQTTVFEQYEKALECLACRMLGEPFNAHRVDAKVMPEMLSGGLWGQIVAECQKQYPQSARYTAGTVADALKIQRDTAFEFARRHTELDLAFAFELFFAIYCRYVEAQVADFTAGWIVQGLTAEEIRVNADKMRREKGATLKATGSDGKVEFEAELLAALDGKVVDYPVKPHIRKMREIVPHYEPGAYVVTAALSGVGKTYYALNTIYHNSVQGIPCCYINLEMSPKDVVKRMWQIHGGTKFNRRMSVTDAEIEKHIRTFDDVCKLPFYAHNPGRTLPAILATIRNEYVERRVQLVVIDYAQLIVSPEYRGNRNYELGEISASLRALALDLNIVIVVMAQLRQEVMKTGDRKGGLYDVKDCANFTQDASFVHLLYRPFYLEVYQDETGNDYAMNYAEVRTVKGRETGKIEVVCQFDEIHGFQDPEPISNQFPVVPPVFNPAAVPNTRTEEAPF